VKTTAMAKRATPADTRYGVVIPADPEADARERRRRQALRVDLGSILEKALKQ
jgi:hypothetical protein